MEGGSSQFPLTDQRKDERKKIYILATMYMYVFMYVDYVVFLNNRCTDIL